MKVPPQHGRLGSVLQPNVYTKYKPELLENRVERQQLLVSGDKVGLVCQPASLMLAGTGRDMRWSDTAISFERF